MNTVQSNALRGLELAERNANDNPLTDDVAYDETTFATVNDVSRYINAYHECYVGNGMCAPYNRDILRGWLRNLGLTDAQMHMFFDRHGIPYITRA